MSAHSLSAEVRELAESLGSEESPSLSAEAIARCRTQLASMPFDRRRAAAIDLVTLALRVTHLFPKHCRIAVEQLAQLATFAVAEDARFERSTASTAREQLLGRGARESPPVDAPTMSVLGARASQSRGKNDD